MIEDFERPEKPMYRLAQVCYNCRFFRRKQYNLYRRFGYCTIAKYMYQEIKKLPKKEQRVYFDETPLDASCDNHQFRGGSFVKTAEKVSGAKPRYE